MFSMNIKIQNCVFLCLIAFLASCSAPKEVLYLQDIASIKEENLPEKETIQEFVTELCERYREELYGERPVLFKMKELWHYLIQSFDADEKIAKKIKKAQRISEYEITVKKLFSNYDLKI